MAGNNNLQMDAIIGAEYSLNSQPELQDFAVPYTAIFAVVFSLIMFAFIWVYLFGVILYFVGVNKPALREKGKYIMSLFFPSVLFLLLGPVIDASFGFNPSPVISALFYLVFSLYVMVIFIRGLKIYKKYKLTDKLLKNRGIIQMFVMGLYFSMFVFNVIIYTIFPY